jgi:hypothetical protein
MRFLRRKPAFKELMKQGRGNLTDQSGRADVQLDWNLNEQSAKDTVFKITINGEEAYIDLEELTFYTRAMFK